MAKRDGVVKGKLSFQGKGASGHGQELQGLIGAN